MRCAIHSHALSISKSLIQIQFASVALALIRTRSLLDGADKLMLPGARVLGSIIAQDNFALKVIAGLILRVVISQNLLPAKLCWPYDFPGDRLPSCRFPTQDNDVWLECFQTFLSRFQKHYTIEQESQ